MFGILLLWLIPITESRSMSQTVIFIPGYKGSVLKECDSKKVVWLSLSELLFKRRSLQLNDALPIQHSGATLCAHGVLEQIQIIPGLYAVNIYHTWLQSLRRHLPAGDKLLVFHYDWRQDNFLAIKQLADMIEQEASSGPVSLIAHSMGGLIASHYLRYGERELNGDGDNWLGAQRVDKVVFAGVPFRGTVPMFRRMQTGSKTAWNQSLLSARAIGSFDSAFQLLPFEPARYVYRLDGTPIEEDMFDSDTWSQYNWGLFQFDAIKNHPQSRELLHSKLQRAKRLHELRHQPIEPAENHTGEIPRLSILNVVGEAHPTLARIYWQDDETNQGSTLLKTKDAYQTVSPELRPFIHEDGDGNVTVASAQLPHSWSSTFNKRHLSTQYEHGSLFDDIAVQKAIFKFLNFN